MPLASKQSSTHSVAVYDMVVMNAAFANRYDFATAVRLVSCREVDVAASLEGRYCADDLYRWSARGSGPR